MLETLLFGLAILAGVGLALIGILLIPILLIAGFVKLLVFLIVLPFRVLGAVAGASGAAFGVLAKVLFALMGLAFALILLVVGVLAIPLVPLLLLGALVWITISALRPRRSRQPASRVQIESRPA